MKSLDEYDNSKVVSIISLLFLFYPVFVLKNSNAETEKMPFISLQKLFSFLRFSNFRILES